MQSLTVTIQEVILDRFCHLNPVPTKNVAFPPCWKIIIIISLVPYTARHTLGAVVPGREIQVLYMHLNFSSRYAMLIAISGTNYYIPTEQQEFWNLKLWYMWSIGFWSMGTNNHVRNVFNVDPQRKSYLHWIEIWDLITGTDYGNWLLPLSIYSTLILTPFCMKIVDIA